MKITRIEFSHWLTTLRIEPGEHALAIGSTGSGKSYVTQNFLQIAGEQNPHTDNYMAIVKLRTKNKQSGDKTVTKLALEHDKRDGIGTIPFKKTSPRIQQSPTTAKIASKLYDPSYWIIWPKNAKTLSEQGSQSREIASELINTQFMSKNGWLLLDEMLQLDEWGLTPDLKLYYRLGRSAGAALIAASQRAAHIPRDAYEASTHLILFNSGSTYETGRYSDISESKREIIQTIVPRLERHDFLYMNMKKNYDYSVTIVTPDKKGQK